MAKVTLHKRIFYQKPTAAATKAEKAKQHGRILRFRAKLVKEMNEKMKAMKKKEDEKMAKFMKGKRTKKPAKKTTKRRKQPSAASLTDYLFGAKDFF